MSDMYREIFCDGVKETKDNICEIISEGEATIIGREVTLARIKDYVHYNHWLKEMTEND